MNTGPAGTLMDSGLELEPEGGWAGPAAPRLAPPQSHGLVFRLLSLAARGFGRRQVPDVFRVIGINRRLLWPWLLFASRLMPRGQIAATDREKVILRIGWNCRSRYEWGQHVEIGLKVGLSDQDILRVTRGPEGCSDPFERALFSACDELCRGSCVSDATWAVLRERYADHLLIELLMLAGHYQMIAGFLNSAGLRLEPPIAGVVDGLQRRLRPGA
jgi:4-carboxymuconolactone decarboxylase